jgi:DNA modification methylase
LIYQGDALTVLRSMPDESVQMCVTSPPYWGLRSYGTDPIVFGGDPTHAHAFAEETVKTEVGRGDWAQGVNGRGEEQPGGADAKREPIRATATRGFCECGAWRGDLGLEPTPELFVSHMVEIFREVRRVLKPDGVLFCNMGDSYATGAGKVGDRPGGGEQGDAWAGRLKPKDLAGVPWMLAFALRADGWWLRQDIIWHKPAPMPESVLDRCTKAHEYIFLLTKSERYYFDAKAIAEPVVARNLHDLTGPGYEAPGQTPQRGSRSGNKARKPASARGVPEGTTRNKRSVWTINTKAFHEAHFATFPEELPILCVMAGSKPGDTVLDPFNGAGTVGVVCEKLQRRYVGIELNPAYVEMANRRIAGVAPLFSQGDQN